MGKGGSVSKLIGIIGAVVIVALICWPIISTISEKTEKTALNGAVTNAYTVFLYSEAKNVSMQGDILFVFDGKVMKVKNNNIRDIEIMEDYPKVTRVELGEPLTEGEYAGGTYIRQDETDYFAVSLATGDSLAGLRKADNVHDFPGYRYYGHLENCDVYIPA